MSNLLSMFCPEFNASYCLVWMILFRWILLRHHFTLSLCFRSWNRMIILFWYGYQKLQCFASMDPVHQFCLLQIMFFSLYFPADSEDYYGCSGINCHDCWSLSRMTLKVFVVLLSLTWLIDSEASLASSTSIFNKNLYRCTVWCKQYKHPCKNITWQKEIWLDVLYRNPLENKVDGSVVSGGLKIHISLKIMFSSYLCMLGTGIVKSNTHLKLKWITKMVFFCN